MATSSRSIPNPRFIFSTPSHPDDPARSILLEAAPKIKANKEEFVSAPFFVWGLKGGSAGKRERKPVSGARGCGWEAAKENEAPAQRLRHLRKCPAPVDLLGQTGRASLVESAQHRLPEQFACSAAGARMTPARRRP